VPRQEIDRRFFDAAYYITPNEPVGHDAFAVIREAMRRKALVALGRIVLSKRERVMALDPCERGLIGTTLRYPYEVRDIKNYFEDIPDLTPAPELLRLAEHILDSKLAAFDPSAFRDRYEEASCPLADRFRPARRFGVLIGRSADRRAWPQGRCSAVFAAGLSRLIPLTQVRLYVVGASIPLGSHFCVDCLA
jgi:non-homologous end joining protein Ku